MPPYPLIYMMLKIGPADNLAIMQAISSHHKNSKVSATCPILNSPQTLEQKKPPNNGRLSKTSFF
jgi:hypothetical protein